MGLTSLKFGRKNDETVSDEVIRRPIPYREEDLKTQELHKKDVEKARAQYGPLIWIKMKITMPVAFYGTRNEILKRDGLYEVPERTARGLVESGFAEFKTGGSI